MLLCIVFLERKPIFSHYMSILHENFIYMCKRGTQEINIMFYTDTSKFVTEGNHALAEKDLGGHIWRSTKRK